VAASFVILPFTFVSLTIWPGKGTPTTKFAILQITYVSCSNGVGGDIITIQLATRTGTGLIVAMAGAAAGIGASLSLTVTASANATCTSTGINLVLLELLLVLVFLGFSSPLCLVFCLVFLFSFIL